MSLEDHRTSRLALAASIDGAGKAEDDSANPFASDLATTGSDEDAANPFLEDAEELAKSVEES